MVSIVFQNEMLKLIWSKLNLLIIAYYVLLLWAQWRVRIAFEANACTVGSNLENWTAVITWFIWPIFMGGVESTLLGRVVV